MKNIIKKIFTNKIVLYMFSRYITYALAFFVNMFAADRMGPDNYGIWSYLLLIFNYLMFLDLGIPYSVQVFMIQNKEDKFVSADYEKTGLSLIGIVALSALFVSAYFFLGGIDKAHELNVGWLFHGMCFCGMLNFFNLFYDRVGGGYIQTSPNYLTLNSITPNRYAFRSTIAA